MPDIHDLIISLIYVSAATKLLSKEELIALLQESSRRNIEYNITGLLLYKDGNIMQVLEGPAHAVDTIFAKIKKDPRHKNVGVLIRKPILARSFPDWGMAFRDLESPELRELPGYSDFLNTPFSALATPTQSQLLLDQFKRTM
jgi:hypothetical protein